MELNTDFVYCGWTIRYTLHSPPSPQATNATPIVFVHGTPSSSATFVPLAQALSAQTSSPILLYDLPGYGHSQNYTPQPTNLPTASLSQCETSIKFQAEALAALLNHVHLDGKQATTLPPHIVAHDIAGTIVLRAHLLLHCNFRSLLLMDTNADLPRGDAFYTLVRSNPEVFVNLPEHVFEAVLRATIRSACCSREKFRGGWGACPS